MSQLLDRVPEHAVASRPGRLEVAAATAGFAVAHGITPILPVAFVNGVIAALLLFHRTGSIWPGVMVHLVNNT